MREGDTEALSEFFRLHKERLRRIVSIGLAVRLARVLDEQPWTEDSVRLLLLAQRDADVETEAGLLHWLARVIDTEVRRSSEMVLGASADRRRSLSVDEDAAQDALRTQREEMERVIDQLVAELEPRELRDVLLLRDYCGADWELVRERMKLLSIEAAQELHRRAHRHLAKRMHPRLRKPR